MIAVIVYFLAIVGANLSIAYFGAWVSPINSFLFIGLDLSLRDYLHQKWQEKNLMTKMTLLIVGAGVVSYFLNPASGQIAIASVIAFVASGFVNTFFYKLLSNKSFLKKSNYSNIPAAAVDSLLFPAIAFGSFLPVIVLFQFLAKVSGGFVWALVMNIFIKENRND